MKDLYSSFAFGAFLTVAAFMLAGPGFFDPQPAMVAFSSWKNELGWVHLILPVAVTLGLLMLAIACRLNHPKGAEFLAGISFMLWLSVTSFVFHGYSEDQVFGVWPRILVLVGYFMMLGASAGMLSKAFFLVLDRPRKQVAFFQ